MSIFWPFLANVLSTTWISSTKLKFRWKFWGAEQIYMQKETLKCKKRNKLKKTFFFLQNWKRTEREIFVLCVMTFEPIQMIETRPAPQNDCLNFSFVNNNHVDAKKWPELVLKRPFISRESHFSLRKFKGACASAAPGLPPQFILFDRKG